MSLKRHATSDGSSSKDEAASKRANTNLDATSDAPPPTAGAASVPSVQDIQRLRQQQQLSETPAAHAQHLDGSAVLNLFRNAPELGGLHVANLGFQNASGIQHEFNREHLHHLLLSSSIPFHRTGFLGGAQPASRLRHHHHQSNSFGNLEAYHQYLAGISFGLSSPLSNLFTSGATGGGNSTAGAGLNQPHTSLDQLPSLEARIQAAQLMSLGHTNNMNAARSNGALPSFVGAIDSGRTNSGAASQVSGTATGVTSISSAVSNESTNGNRKVGNRRKRPPKRTSSDDPKQVPPKETFLSEPGPVPPALPPAVQAPTPHFSQRTCLSLATDEDQNWLSELQCYIRSEVLEVFRASSEDVKVRNNSKTLVLEQVGIRCRFCAHLPPGKRASRSSAFPSSIPQIYQSFTMMLRDHFSKCSAIPSPHKAQLESFKTKTSQGASDSKNYWMHAARRIGMVNTAKGIEIDDDSRQNAARIPPFGTNSDTLQSLEEERQDTTELVLEEDREICSEYLYLLLSQMQRIRLSSSERVGNRKSLTVGLPGFGCRYCCQSGRLGLSRVFPARRRTLPGKIPDLHEHLQRCQLCPCETKKKLKALSKNGPGYGREINGDNVSTNDREFFSRIWSRLGHGDRPEP